MNAIDLLEKGNVPVEVLKLVGGSADALGVEAYVVGGYVRDLVLERPSKDIDFVCVGSGIQLAKTLAECLQESSGKKVNVSIFENFGTASLRFKDWELEFVGARKESYQRDSRKPVVEDGTLKEASFTNPNGILVDKTNRVLYVSEGNGNIRTLPIE